MSRFRTVLFVGSSFVVPVVMGYLLSGKVVFAFIMGAVLAALAGCALVLVARAPWLVQWTTKRLALFYGVLAIAIAFVGIRNLTGDSRLSRVTGAVGLATAAVCIGLTIALSRRSRNPTVRR